MRPTRVAGCWTIATAVLWLLAPAASAVECGQPEQAGQSATVGTLTLSVDATPLEPLDFKDSTDDQSFILQFKVTGCEINSKEGITGRARLSNGQDALGKVILTPKGTLLTAEVPVTPEKFPAEVVHPLLTISGAPIQEVSVRLTMQRKEPLLVPGALALVAALIGGGCALWLAYGAVKEKQKSNQYVRFKPVQVTIAIGAGVVARYAVFKSAYLDPETWSSNRRASSP